MSTCYRVKCDKLRQPESQAAARGTHSFPHSCGIRTRRPPGSRRYTRTPGLRDPGQYTLRLTPPLAQGKLRHRDASDRRRQNWRKITGKDFTDLRFVNLRTQLFVELRQFY
ncbi:uncharacterized protein PS065_019528 isoform 1-T2 [Dugong dugon]